MAAILKRVLYWRQNVLHEGVLVASVISLSYQGSAGIPLLVNQKGISLVCSDDLLEWDVKTSEKFVESLKRQMGVKKLLT